MSLVSRRLDTKARTRGTRHGLARPATTVPADPTHWERPLHAALITALTGPDGIEVREVPDPVPKPGQVLIDVEYAGVVFPDVLQTRGEYQLRPELPFTPGWEVAGVVRHDAGGFIAGD